MWQTLNAANIEVEGIRTSRTSGVKSRWVDTRPVIRCGFTLIEMLTTVAILVIVFGLLVNLAHHVRERSAVALTQNLVRQLDGMMSAYVARHGQPPAVPPFPPGDGNWTHVEGPSAAIPGSHLRAGGRTMQVEAEPEELVRAAAENSRYFVRALRGEPGVAAGALSELPASLYNDITLLDAWGSPIVFMPSMHPAIGTAPNDRFFFFSAGADRRYLTLDDNIYSYENLDVDTTSR